MTQTSLGVGHAEGTVLCARCAAPVAVSFGTGASQFVSSHRLNDEDGEPPPVEAHCHREYECIYECDPDCKQVCTDWQVCETPAPVGGGPIVTRTQVSAPRVIDNPPPAITTFFTADGTVISRATGPFVEQPATTAVPPQTRIPSPPVTSAPLASGRFGVAPSGVPAMKRFGVGDLTGSFPLGDSTPPPSSLCPAVSLQVPEGISFVADQVTYGPGSYLPHDLWEAFNNGDTRSAHFSGWIARAKKKIVMVPFASSIDPIPYQFTLAPGSYFDPFWVIARCATGTIGPISRDFGASHNVTKGGSMGTGSVIVGENEDLHDVAARLGHVGGIEELVNENLATLRRAALEVGVAGSEEGAYEVFVAEGDALRIPESWRK